MSERRRSRMLPARRPERTMPRYLVERSFPDGLDIPPDHVGREMLARIVACNADRNVTWIHSYVNPERTKSFCVYEASSPEAIRLAARRVGLPVDRITQISLLDPHGYHPR